jgi:hypothetical protein
MSSVEALIISPISYAHVQHSEARELAHIRSQPPTTSRVAIDLWLI